MNIEHKGRMKKQNDNNYLFVKGAMMGVAEVIPGVSGGTIAFITGIYGRLIDAIRSITGILVQPRLLLKPKQLWAHVDGWFLLWVLFGMLSGLCVGIFGVSYLLQHYPEPLWAFFFGLIAASIVYLLRMIRPIHVVQYLSLAIGACVGLLIVLLSPSEGSTSLPFVFLAGSIAICALVLPGISGSFILLLMGMYSTVIPAVKDVLSMQDLGKWPIVLVFGLGCIVGLSLFARLVHWLLARHKKTTLALMTGFMVGSLYKIWPWRNPVRLMDRESQSIVIWTKAQFDPQVLEKYRIIVEKNVLPANYWGEAHLFWVLIAVVLGSSTVLLLSKLEG